MSLPSAREATVRTSYRGGMGDKILKMEPFTASFTERKDPSALPFVGFKKMYSIKKLFYGRGCLACRTLVVSNKANFDPWPLT